MIGEHWYSYAGLTLSSVVELPELPPVALHEQQAADWSFRVTAAPTQLTHQSSTLDSPPTADAAPSEMVVQTVADGLVLRFVGVAEFFIDREGRQIRASAPATVEHATLRHLLLDQVLPRALAHRDRLIVHGASVAVGDRVICFIGETGQGKSTLAASFHEAGHALLSDDAIMLTSDSGTTLAAPLYPALRLWPESVDGLFEVPPATTPMTQYSAKYRVELATPATDVTPRSLGAIFVLEDSLGEIDTEAGPSLSPYSPRDACMAIIANSFQLDPADPQRAARLLQRAGDVAQRVPVYALHYTRSFEHLAQVRKAVLMACNWS